MASISSLLTETECTSAMFVDMDVDSVKDSLSSDNLVTDFAYDVEADCTHDISLLSDQDSFGVYGALFDAGNGWTCLIQPVSQAFCLLELKAIAQRYQRRYVGIACSGQVLDWTDSGYLIQFSLSDYSHGLEIYREIAACGSSSGLIFEEVGVPLQFEDLGAYGRKAVEERLSNHIVLQYARDMGINVDKPDVLVSYVFLRYIRR